MRQKDYLELAKCFQYKFIKKGEQIRRALTEDDKVYFIFEGKVACSLPEDSTVLDPAKYTHKISAAQIVKPSITPLRKDIGRATTI